MQGETRHQYAGFNKRRRHPAEDAAQNVLRSRPGVSGRRRVLRNHPESGAAPEADFVEIRAGAGKPGEDGGSDLGSRPSFYFCASKFAHIAPHVVYCGVKIGLRPLHTG
ncbi:protein of unknown function [Kyrpidia spormannii]|uniref:Uncharacterized protein n=1 Tax=Kyrpidia spormannii TaxID=2055160 RepID=A0A6F9E839_9BACL|nr:protein of unknown function [Kyrpidia spormannii]